MNKRSKTLIILAAVLAVFAVVFFVWRGAAGQGADTTAATQAETFAVPSVSAAQVTGIDLTVHNAESDTQTHIVLTLEGDAWKWSADGTVPLDAEAVEELLAPAAGLRTQYRLTDVSAADLAAYGLSQPSRTVVYTLADGSTRTYRIGIKNTFNGLYYLTDASDPATVYLVAAGAAEALDVTLMDLISLDSMPKVAAGQYVTVTAQSGTKNVVFTYYPTGNTADYTDAYKWYVSIDGAPQVAVGSEMASALENVLTYGYLNKCVSYDRADGEKYGFAQPSALTVAYKSVSTVKDPSTGQSTTVTTPAQYTLFFGEISEAGEYYVRTEDSDLIYTVAYSGTYEKLFSGDMALLFTGEIISLNMDYVTGATVTVGDRSIREVITHAGSETTYRDEAGVLLYAMAAPRG